MSGIKPSVWLDYKELTGLELCVLFASYELIDFTRAETKENALKKEIHFDKICAQLKKATKENIGKKLNLLCACPQERILGYVNKPLLSLLKIIRIFESYYDIYSKIKPAEFIEWALTIQSIEVPEPMIRWYKNYNKIQENKKNNFIIAQDKINGKRENSYKKTIITLLEKLGKYPPNRDTTSWLKTEIEKSGFKLNEDTIRDILQGLQTVEPKRNTDF